jgi:hypothetical protein
MALKAVLRGLGAAAVVALAGSALSAKAMDEVLRWNEIAQQAVAAGNAYVQSRSMAITQLAVLRALERAEGSRAAGTGTTEISSDAAVAAAAHAALSTLAPDSGATLDAALAAVRERVPNGPAEDEGVAVGEAAANAILAARAGDGWDATVEYAPSGAAGAWVPTPPAFAPALLPSWGKVTPFTLERPDQFRPAPPSSPASARYAAGLREVLEMGGETSDARPPEASRAAAFWTISAVQGWNPAARQVSTASRRSMGDNARLFALLNIAMADALIACFDAKYTYNTWRPVTAIRAGVGQIEPVPDWLPLLVTPPFPAYPSGHACAAGAAQEVLEGSFGSEGHDITLTSTAVPGASFTYASFAAIADQIDDARVYGGIHIREDQVAGRALGRAVARHAAATYARPAPSLAGRRADPDLP